MFVSALLKEILLQQNYLKDEEISTIYIGGGTPSLLETSEIQKIIEEIYLHYKIADKVEITLEANPDDLNDEKLKQLSETAINRLSIGIQSFHDTDLQYLNRSHSAEQANRAIKNAQNAGFLNLSIDLIYGIPTLSEQAWLENIEIAVKMGIPHISAYCLTVETGTALDLFIKQGKMPAIDEDKANQDFEILMDLLERNGYVQYEISNFCKKGFVSQHNSNYWKQKKYLGLGPSAHSFNLASRQWNVSNITSYIQSIEKEIIPFEIEILSLSQQYEEYILTGLRTIWGVNEDFILRNYGSACHNYFTENVASFISKALISKKASVYLLTKEGKYFADGIASSLFMD